MPLVHNFLAMFALHSAEPPPAGSWFDDYIGLLHDPAHILFEITISILFDFFIVYFGYNFVFKTKIVPRLRREIHKEIDDEHHVAHHDHLTGDEKIVLPDSTTPRSNERASLTLAWLVYSFGLKYMSSWLGFTTVELQEFMAGSTKLDAESARLIIDLAFIYDLAMVTHSHRTAISWLDTNEPRLGGDTPISAIRDGQTSKVYEVWRAKTN